MSQSRAFIELLKPHAMKAWKKHKIIPSVLIAQAIIETNYGRHSIENNLFNIKVEDKKLGKLGQVFEYSNGEWAFNKYLFKKYDSFELSMSDYVDKLIEEPYYFNIIENRDYCEVALIIGDSEKPEDKNYGEVIIGVIEAEQLQLIDNECFEADTINLKQDIINVITHTWLLNHSELAQKLQEAHTDRLSKTAASRIIGTFLEPALNKATQENQKAYISYLIEKLRKATVYKNI